MTDLKKNGKKGKESCTQISRQGRYESKMIKAREHLGRVERVAFFHK